MQNVRVLERRMVRIPRSLLHISLDDLVNLGIGDDVRQALRGLLADLPLCPDSGSSAQLIGPPQATLPSLAVVARHVGQGLRDANLAMAHDRIRLRAERRKLIFLTAVDLNAALTNGDERPGRDAALFVSDVPATEAEPLTTLLRTRESAGLVSFVTSTTPVADFSHWRILELEVER